MVALIVREGRTARKGRCELVSDQYVVIRRCYTGHKRAHAYLCEVPEDVDETVSRTGRIDPTFKTATGYKPLAAKLDQRAQLEDGAEKVP